jgi:hypothetical protein
VAYPDDRFTLLVCLVAMALAIALAPSLSHAQTAATEPAATSPPTSTVNPLTQAAVQQGVLSCATRVNQVSNFMGFGPQAGAVLMTPAAQADQRIFPIAMELPTESAVAYVAASFAPNQANGCGAVYDAVSYWPQACEALAAKQFSGLKRVGLIKSAITVLDAGAASKVFLMPAGSGCVSIKKEVVL